MVYTPYVTNAIIFWLMLLCYNLLMKVKTYVAYIPYAVFIIAFLATLTSLFFSEILKFTPCTLCWYQRVFMFPLAFITAVNIMRKHADIYYYVLPLSIIGFFIGLYQNLLVWKILPESVAPCQIGVSCITQPLVLFGFITIPLGSMLTFALISVLMLLYAKLEKNYGTKPAAKKQN
jgi:disulfide bond formation protein DsbB